MNAARLASIPEFGRALDLETHLIQAGLLAPPIVCGSIAGGYAPIVGRLLDKAEAFETFRLALLDPRVVIIGANIPFDLFCVAVHAARRGIDLMPAIFAAYDQERVYDVLRAAELHAIALGCLGTDPRTGKKLSDPITGKRAGYSLAVVTELELGRCDAKANDSHRGSYALLEGIPIEQWPPAARAYPVDDVVNTHEDCLAQIGHLPGNRPHIWRDDRCLACGADALEAAPSCTVARPNLNLHDLSFQVYAHWALYLGAAYGFEPDQAAVDALEARVTAGYEDRIQPFIAAGIVRPKVDKEGKRSQDQRLTKRLIAMAYGCSQPCAECDGNGHTYVPGPPRKDGKGFTKGKDVKCIPCDGSGYELTDAVPRTVPKNPEKLPGVGIGRDALFESGEETLMNFAAFKEDDKIRLVYIPFLRGENVRATDDEDEQDEESDA